MERRSAKKLNKLIGLILAAALLACALPSVSLANGVTPEPLETLASSGGTPLPVSSAPEITPAPTPVITGTPAPAPAPEPTVSFTPEPAASFTPGPAIQITPSPAQEPEITPAPQLGPEASMPLPEETEEAGQVLLAGILAVSNLTYISVETPDNPEYVLGERQNPFNKRIEIQVVYDGRILESEVRYYGGGHSFPVYVQILHEMLKLSKIDYLDKNGWHYNAQLPFTINLNANDPNIIRIELGSNISFASSTDACSLQGRIVDLTDLVSVSSGFTGGIEFYNAAGDLISSPENYEAVQTESITARAVDGVGLRLAETTFTLCVYDPVLAPASQTIFLGESAVVSVDPDTLYCELHPEESFSFDWTSGSEFGGMQQTSGQSITVTPSKAGTYTYEVEISHFDGTDTQIKTLTASVEVLDGTLVLSHEGHGGVCDPNQSFIFEVVRSGYNGSDTETFYEVIQGDGTKIIRGLKFGTYTVTAISGWSWRYVPEHSHITVDLGRNPDGVSFDVTDYVSFRSARTFLYWLSGEAFATNRNL
ncbi:MAG: hypothetical protein BWY11_01233 [Firmicutes bacterium ADurb.Bin182]|nr:MAG: hypothetical protein BWY11_01233 [Firmicutes bacterium ADurb.Bin182]